MSKIPIDELKLIPIDELKKDKLVKLKRVAEILGCCPRTAYDRWSDGHFRFVKDGGNLRIWENSVYEYLQRLTAIAGYEHGVVEATEKDFFAK